MTNVTKPDENNPPPERDFVAEYRAREREQRESSQWQQLSGTAIEFAVSIVLGAVAGWGFDRWRGTEPWGLVIGVILGFVTGFYLLLKVAARSFK